MIIKYFYRICGLLYSWYLDILVINIIFIVILLLLLYKGIVGG